jgi:hypothetical protein
MMAFPTSFDELVEVSARLISAVTTVDSGAVTALNALAVRLEIFTALFRL